MGLIFSLIKTSGFIMILGAIYLLLDTILIYILPPFPQNVSFLSLKQHLISSNYWLVSFYIHICSSLLVMIFGATQFSKSIMRNHTRRHRFFGKIYVGLILILAAPSGFILALEATGGTIAQIGFVVQSYAWWSCTFLALFYIRKKKIIQHGKWMVRSYALTLSAVTLRAISYFSEFLQLPLHYEEVYIFSAWFSWVFNLFIAEFMIKKGLVNYFMSGEE